MKTSKTLFVGLLLVSATFISSCKKDKKEVPAPVVIPTSLELTIKDIVGNIVPGASVMLYSTRTDWENSTHPVTGSSKITDASGKVKFTDLSSIRYYYDVAAGCKNNAHGNNSVSALSANANNTTEVIILNTGNIEFNNTSSDPYSIYVNGTYWGDVQPGSTGYDNFEPTGAYSVRVLQVSGYIVSPTDNTFTSNLNCGDVFTVTIP